MLAGLGLLFLAANLWPWRALVGPAELAVGAAFGLGLCVLAALLARLVVRVTALRPPAAALLAGVLVLLPAWAWNRRGPPDVFVVVLDSLRAQNVSAWGHHRATTPRLDAFAAEHGVRLTRFYAQAAETDKAIPAILGGIQPGSFYDPERDGTDFSVPPHVPLLPELLAPRGYRSFGLSSNPKIRGELGYARAFDRWEDAWTDTPRAATVFARLRAALEGAGSAPQLHFALVLDPHMPYEPEPAYRFGELATSRELTRAWERGELAPDEVRAGALELYDGEIREVDAALGEYLDALVASERWSNALVIVTADHGEKFFEHGEFGHGGRLFEEVVHIPAVLRLPSPLRIPSLRPRADAWDGLASQVDLAPTVLAAARAGPGPEHLAGRDLRPALHGTAAWEPRPVLMEQLEPARSLRALRDERWKLELLERPGEPPRRVLSDLSSPAGEGADWDSPPPDPAVLEALVQRLQRRAGVARRHYRPRTERHQTDPAILEQLRELGYTH